LEINGYKQYFQYISMNYTCDLCNFKTNLSANYKQHLQTKKHIKNTEQKQYTHETTMKKPRKTMNLDTDNHEKTTKNHELYIKTNEPHIETNKLFVCKYCDKKFKHKNSMYHHIKYSCKKNKDEDLKELVRLLNLQLEQQRTYVEKKDKQIDSQQKQIDKLMEKLQVPHVSNTTTNNIQNNIRLSYQNTDMSRITDADYRKSINCLLMCVKTFIGIVHLNPAHPENMNIYISNLKDKYIMVYSGDTWELRNREYEMDNLYDNNEMLLTEWVEEHGNEELQNKFKNYLERKEQHIDMIREEIRLMLYNKRHLALGE